MDQPTLAYPSPEALKAQEPSEEQLTDILGAKAVEREIAFLETLQKTVCVGIKIFHMNKTVEDLKEYGLISHIGGKTYTLTEKGSKLLNAYQARNLT